MSVRLALTHLKTYSLGHLHKLYLRRAQHCDEDTVEVRKALVRKDNCRVLGVCHKEEVIKGARRTHGRCQLTPRLGSNQVHPCCVLQDIGRSGWQARLSSTVDLLIINVRIKTFEVLQSCTLLQKDKAATIRKWPSVSAGASW